MAFRLLSLVMIAAAAWGAAASAQGVAPPAPRVVMNLAAHPDDEDGNTMAYYRYAQNAVVHSIIFTRGEGGQNEIGPELYAHLGAIRTAETEAAARQLGTQVRFLNFDEFGFSKTAAETFERWGGQEEVTAQVVHLIRKLKPDVLFTNHDTLTVGPRRQHGHHQAVGISAYRAMALAADPTFRPEQLEGEGVDLWQPHRLFIRLWRGGQDTADVRLPVGDLIPEMGRSATDIAVEAVAEHRSQGFDLIAERFRRDTSHFALLWQAPGSPALPEGAVHLADDLPPNPHAVDVDLGYLIDSGRIDDFPAGTLSVSGATALPGQSITLTWPAEEGAHLVLSGAVDTTLTSSPASVALPIDAGHTLPRERRLYERMLSGPPVQAALRDAEGGLLYARHLPLEIAPALVVGLEEAVALPRAHRSRVLLRPGVNSMTVSAEVFAEGATEVSAKVFVDLGDEYVEHRATATMYDPAVEIDLDVELPDHLKPGVYPVVASGWVEHLGLEPSASRLDGHVLPAIRLPEDLRVGFVRSYDAATEVALREMGAEVVPLDSLALATGDFGDLHTIVVDIRGYLDRPDLRAHNDRLLEWVSDGGHMVVTYHKTFEWNVEHFEEGEVSPTGFAPYPLRLGRQRVTQADSPIEHLLPDHPLFHEPNEITPADWDGWIQERGLYFPQEYDDHYVELLAMRDPGEEPLTSSTLLAIYGEGTYLYTALGWYRQLGAFVPGAYRMFANMISLPLIDGRTPRVEG